MPEHALTSHLNLAFERKLIPKQLFTYEQDYVVPRALAGFNQSVKIPKQPE